jgi:isopentenyl-diphosphate delta-isomerase
MDLATRRKLKQEMGIELSTEFAYKFIYKADLENGLIEHELDHVFVGQFDGTPVINKDEVEDWKYMDLKDLRSDAKKNPEMYTHWFKLILDHPEITSLAA